MKALLVLAIFVEGRVRDGQIVPNMCVLGHELQHHLNWINPGIRNPDEW